MIAYYEPLYRPPAEANSIIIQVTYGCSFNKCAFCTMYESKDFRKRTLLEIEKDIKELSHYSDTRRVFLADGDALVLETSFLIQILQLLYEYFPKLQRVSSYASVYNLMNKSHEELLCLKDAGFGLLYFGMETGSKKLLKYVNKPMNPTKMIESLNKVSLAKIKLSVTVILGLGGKKLSQEHILQTAKVINQCEHINYLSTLQLGLDLNKEDEFFKRFEKYENSFEFCSDEDMLKEQKLFIKHLNPKKAIIFRSNHASNALPLKGTLPKDKNKLLETLEFAINDEKLLVPSFLRGF